MLLSLTCVALLMNVSPPERLRFEGSKKDVKHISKQGCSQLL